MFERRWLYPCLLLAALPLAACVREPGGHASFTVASRQNLAEGVVEKVAHIDEERCNHVVLFLVGWGDSPSHEVIIQDALERTGGDMVTNADLQFTAIPAVLYNQNCARVVGDIVRIRTAAAPPAAGAGAPPAPPPAQPAPEGGTP